jgi:sigma-B regulation protein RsbU (phosphoserine phosphatase)
MQEEAREVQSRILGPTRRVPGYDVGVAWRFADGLGGDVFEVIPLEGGRLAVAIADVCGKSLPAALLMASLHAELQGAMVDPSPGEDCRRVAAHMRQRLGPDRFVTLIYAVIDRAEGTLTYVNAGHPPGILAREGRAPVRLVTGGGVIGLDREGAFEEGVVPIEPGDRLVLYTDGLSEAGEPSGEEFGEARLMGLVQGGGGLPASETAARLIEAASDFAGGTLHDDASVLVVTIE